MNTSIADELECDARVQKRAQWEAFDFTLLGEGRVEVQNQSYGSVDAEEHTYVVEVEEGQPTVCSCPYAEYHDGACKHQVAVAGSAAVLTAATESRRTSVATDEGKGESLEEDACPNGDPRCGGPDGDDLPCFACYELEGTA